MLMDPIPTDCVLRVNAPVVYTKRAELRRFEGQPLDNDVSNRWQEEWPGLPVAGRFLSDCRPIAIANVDLKTRANEKESTVKRRS
jgi:hypothetical protein